MAATITLVDAVNASFKLVGMISGTSGELTTFTDSARQTDIDIMLRTINDVNDELFERGIFRAELKEGTFTLALETRGYALPADLVDMMGNPIDKTNNNILFPYPTRGAASPFLQMLEDQTDPTDYTGRPGHWTMDETAIATIRVDTSPTADEVGEVYTFQYQWDINMSATTDTFPFDDAVTRRLYRSYAEIWDLTRKGQINETLFNASMARAVRAARAGPTRKRYGVQ